MYANGDGVSRHYEEAFKWFRKAAEQGHSIAQVDLGLMYLRGEGVAKNPDEAVKWFSLSAEQGNDIAQFHLGLCYFEGVGVSKDDQEAYVWVALAAAQGDEQAHGLLDKLETELTSKQIADAQKRAAEWHPVLH
jgi:TPR repeat protein